MSKSLVQFIIEEQRAIPGVSGDFTGLISDVIMACKQIAHDVNKGALIGVLGSAGSENVQGETQKKLDIITNEVFIKSTEWGGHLAAMASEEMDDVYAIPAQYPKGKYLLVFDPLDGSSNIDVNISVGTIFSILRAPKGVEQPDRRRLPAARHHPGLRRLRAVWPVNDAGDHHRPRRERLHAGPRHRRIHADPSEHEDSRGHAGIRDQCLEHAPLGNAGAALCGRMHRRQGRPARQEFQHALGRLDGGRSASHPDTRRHVHVSQGHQATRARPASCA